MPATARRYDRHMLDTALISSRTVYKTTTYSMAVSDLHLRANTAAGAWTLTLPSVVESEGYSYVITLDAGAAAGAAPNTLTIKDRGDSERWVGNIRLNRPGQYVTLTSDGRTWILDDAAVGVPTQVRKGFYEMFELGFTTADAADGGPPAATGKHILITGGGNVFTYNNIVGQTLTGPAWTDPGMNIAMDQTSGDGVEVSVPLGTNSPHKFVVGTDGAFFCRARFSIADVTGLADMLVGFRKREAFVADPDDYDEMAALNVQAGDIEIHTILNNAATTETDTTANWADGETHALSVHVSSLGVVTYRVDDAVPATVAAFTFDTGEEVVPFIMALQSADLSGDVIVLEWECGYAA